MLFRTQLLVSTALFALALQAQSPFIAKPYLQLGDAAVPAKEEKLSVLWQTADSDGAWSVKVRNGETGPYRDAGKPFMRRILLPGMDAHRVWRADLTGLQPGGKFMYQVLLDGKAVFTGSGHARKTVDQPQRFAVFGDCGSGTAESRAIAYRAFMSDPDYVMIPGDIVYSAGRISEYRTKWYPVYNNDDAGPDAGAPLLRSTLVVGAPGNHDLLGRDFSRFPDILAYYFYWAQPLNGPVMESLPEFKGEAEQIAAFKRASADNYPRMSNFSFDYGNAHWTVIDSNPYMDWTSPALKAWLEKDLASAKNATWKFVTYHHPGYNSSKAHFKDQWMRKLSEVFEKGGVDVVFAGHVHNYQRSFPLKAKGTEEWVLDKEFDGKAKTKPSGVIYLVTGAGGARLYNPEQQPDPATWQSFTEKFIADKNTFTLVNIEGKKMAVKQVAADGSSVDEFQITK